MEQVAVFETFSAAVGNLVFMGICFSYRIVLFCGTRCYHVLALAAFRSITHLPKADAEYVGSYGFLDVIVQSRMVV